MTKKHHSPIKVKSIPDGDKRRCAVCLTERANYLIVAEYHDDHPVCGTVCSETYTAQLEMEYGEYLDLLGEE